MASGQARDSLQDWWLESHGTQPSPLARHEIFQGSQTASSTAGQPGQLSSWMDELQQGLGSRQEQVPQNGPALSKLC